MKKFTKALCLLLVLVMAFSLAACGKEKEPEVKEEALVLQPEVDAAAYQTASQAAFDAALGDFAKTYAVALAEVNDMNKRYALEAIAEAKLMESAVYVPGSSNGGNYAIGRVAPGTSSPCLWGLDNYKYHNVLVVDQLIPADERAEMKAKWKELKGTGTYEAWAKQYLTGKGYKLQDVYNIGYSSDPQTWDALATYRSADSEAIINTFDFLMEYDAENVQQYALAESHTVSDDGLVYTFKIRKGAVWTDYQGRKIADVTANDFVYGMQHLLDAKGGTEYLAGVVVGANDYLDGVTTDFATVGVKALDDYTLEYTLVEPTAYFLSMLTYNPFAPLCKTYYESQGGKFGEDFAADDPAYVYGTDPEHIAYCGPYLVKSYTPENSIVFDANPTYWNKSNINIKTINWYFNDGTDALKAYNDMKAGTLTSAGLNASALTQAKTDGLFDKYHYLTATDATSFGTFFNINRQYFANVNDATAVVTSQTKAQADRTNAAMNNVHFRRALAFALDRAAYNAQSVGDELALVSVINSYTPGTFVALDADTTVDINGKATTFKAGTYYGAIMQAQLDADGFKAKVWDPNGDDGIGSSAGFDGWYNADNAKAELEAAIKDLGIEITKDNPIYIDLPTFTGSTTYINRATAYKQSVEKVFDGAVIVNLTDCPTSAAWYYAGYYCDYGYECNYNMYDVSGWGPDYGDPQTYLSTLYGENGDMIHCLGIF